MDLIATETGAEKTETDATKATSKVNVPTMEATVKAARAELVERYYRAREVLKEFQAELKEDVRRLFGMLCTTAFIATPWVLLCKISTNENI